MFIYRHIKSQLVAFTTKLSLILLTNHEITIIHENKNTFSTNHSIYWMESS